MPRHRESSHIEQARWDAALIDARRRDAPMGGAAIRHLLLQGRWPSPALRRVPDASEDWYRPAREYLAEAVRLLGRIREGEGR